MNTDVSSRVRLNLEGATHAWEEASLDQTQEETGDEQSVVVDTQPLHHHGDPAEECDDCGGL